MSRLDIPRIPYIDGKWWHVGNNPDLGGIISEKQVVDHCFFQAANEKWQLWACIRYTKVGRIFYRWQGDSIEQRNWTPMGIVMRSDPKYGESYGHSPGDEMLQAPHAIKEDGKYYMFYGGGGSPYAKEVKKENQICLATSLDGINFTRHKSADGYSQIFHGPGYARDPMVIKIGSQYLCYYCGNLEQKNWQGVVALRTSFDLINWSEYTIVSTGGSPGYHASSAECPFIIFLEGYHYLFRSSSYAPPRNHVYRSKDPMNFGIDSDEKKIAFLPAAAPEIIQIGKQFYISTVTDLKGGIQVAKLGWYPPL